MGITLPNPGEVSIPEPPISIKQVNLELYEYLKDFKRSIKVISEQAFSNSYHIATALNLGTSGTFVISSGGSIIVTSGVVITVTS